MAEEKKVSLLEKSLSLSRNGGIYYGGARVKPDERTAVLCVGLGGSGADILIRIKDQVKNRMILPMDETGAPIADSPKNIGFLEIDTDATVKNMSYGSSHFDPFGNEFCDISVNSVPDVIADIKRAKKTGVECWQWFDDDINQVAGAKGAGGIRQIGRMLLANNIEKVVNDVDGKIMALTQDNPQINSLLIYLFSGISGGTGAGTFLDMAYILRKTARRRNPNVNIMGYLVMTDVNELNGGKTESLRTNGFSCLKELDYWMSSGEHGERYYQKFPNGFELNEFACPFDFCHLLDASDKEGHHFNYDKILRSVAENVFAYIAGEMGTGGNATATMAQLYINIDGYIKTATSLAKYPACYNYLSPGASKIEIPYTEISTLVAARVFERLANGMFRNRPTEQKFNEAVYRDLEMTEETIRSALYRNVNAPRPILNDKNYKYTDAWPNNAPYQAAHNWLALFQRAVVQQAGNLPAYLEGKLKDFIRTNLKDKKTGPIYLRYFVKSDQTYCLYHMLSAFRKYCLELKAQCAGRSKELNDIMQQSYAEGSSLGFGGNKAKALKNYLNAVDAWYTNEEHAFLNEKIAEVIEKVQSRLQLYYENILRPLADVLLELPHIFEENVEYIKVQESMVDEGTDILIRPLEFERTRKNEFDAAVLQAENQFLGSMAENIRKWIGRDIDGVDENIATSVDIGGFISSFISSNFSALLKINMESIMETRLKNGESFSDYVKNRVEDLLNSSYPMYKESPGLTTSVEQFALISVPGDCSRIEAVTRQHIKDLNLRHVMVKRSEEKSRMYIIKIASGYPLYSNAFIAGMETEYEKLMGDQSTSSGKHLKPEWGERLPSPFTELAWKEPYVCRRTQERNKKYRAYFDQCMRNGIIVRDTAGLLLKRADSKVAASVSRANLTAPTILGKMEQFEKIKAKLWNDDSVIKLHTCSRYMREQQDPDGDVKNIRENILRFPHILDSLEEECRLADRIESIEEELHYPKYFALAEINHMIFTNKITGDTSYRRTESDPFPVNLTKGQEMHPDYKDFQIFKSFCGTLDQDMKEEIDLQYDNLKKRIEISKEALDDYVSDINKHIQGYRKQEEKARNAMYNASKEDRPSYLEKIEFYQGSVEELERMLPMEMDREEQPAVSDSGNGNKTVMPGATVFGSQPAGGVQQAVGAGQSVKPPRYLDPQTWQPIADPQPGQQVFDTETKQMTVYQGEAPRYLDPQTWQPIANPQPGQQVFDTVTKQMTVYQGEAPRYLDPQTWQPIADPQPGQMVFDTVTKQMISYSPF